MPGSFHAYTTLFSEELQDAKARFNGNGSEFCSSVIAGAAWTSSEKFAFFRSLNRHSRLRPDMIAEDVTTKSLSDVCAYLEWLGAAALECDSQPFPEAAYEVSNDWVAFEEYQASLLSYSEALCTGQERETTEQPTIAKTDTLKCLDLPRLVVLDNLIRNAEDSFLNNAHSINRKADEQETQRATPDALELTSVEPSLSANNTRIGGSDTDLHSMTTAERERLRKRMYMRRKRAKETGTTVEMQVGRLKPGRKGKQKLNHEPIPESSQNLDTISENETDNEDDDDGDNVPRPSKKVKVRGKTLPLKIKAELEDAQVDVGDLQKDGLDLFHLSKLGKLMSFYIARDDLQLQYETVEYLRAHLVHFLTCVTHHSIVSADQERRAKSHTKVWGGRQLDEVKPQNVNIALRAIGAEPTKAPFFRNFATRQGWDRSHEDDGDSLLTNDNDSDPRNLTGIQHRLPPHNFAHTCAFIPEGDDPIVDEEDDKELRFELKADKKQDKVDQLAAVSHEWQLWKMFGIDHEVSSSRDEGVDVDTIDPQAVKAVSSLVESPASRAAGKKRKRKSRIKSSKLIEESDGSL